MAKKYGLISLLFVSLVLIATLAWTLAYLKWRVKKHAPSRWAWTLATVDLFPGNLLMALICWPLLRPFHLETLVGSVFVYSSTAGLLTLPLQLLNDILRGSPGPEGDGGTGLSPVKGE